MFKSPDGKCYVNGEEIISLTKDEYKDMHKDKIKATEKKWNDMTKAEQLNMMMYACNSYKRTWIRGIKNDERYDNQCWVSDQYERNAWKDEAMEEYTNDR